MGRFSKSLQQESGREQRVEVGESASKERIAEVEQKDKINIQLLIYSQDFNVFLCFSRSSFSMTVLVFHLIYAGRLATCHRQIGCCVINSEYF